MRISDVFCYAVLTVTIAVTAVRADAEGQKDLEEKSIHKISKRAVSVLIDKYPIKPKYQVYRRASRYSIPSGIPYNIRPTRLASGTKYWSKKKFKKSKRPHYYYGSKKKRQGNGRYAHRYKSHYSTIKNRFKKPQMLKLEPSGFGEPPMFDQGHGEPPMNSFGGQMIRDEVESQNVKDVPMELYSNSPAFDPGDPRFQHWVDSQTVDNVKAHSKKKPYSTIPVDLVQSPDQTVLYTQNGDESFGLNNYDEMFKFGRKIRGKKQNYYNKKLNQMKKVKATEEEEIVGGQYAEPPARYVHRNSPSSIHRSKEYQEDAEMSGSEPVSSYVNYKHSNMAFSPQNLNDAFSIID